MRQAAEDFTATPSPADEVAYFQLSGGTTGTPKLIPRTHNDYYYSVRRSNEICGFNEETRFLCAIPAAHNYAMSSPGALGVFRQRNGSAGDRSQRHALFPADRKTPD